MILYHSYIPLLPSVLNFNYSTTKVWLFIKFLFIPRVDNNTYGVLPVPTRTDSDFLGWYTALSGGAQVSASTIMSNGNITLFAHWKIHTTISTTTGKFTGILDVPAGATKISVTMSDCSYACTDSAGHEGQVCYIYICSTLESLGDLGYYYNPWTGGTATADISGRSTVYVKTNWVHWQYHYNCKNEIHYITITFE